MSLNEKLMSVLLVLLICLVATEVGRRAVVVKCSTVQGFSVSRTVLSFSTDTLTCHYEKSK